MPTGPRSQRLIAWQFSAQEFSAAFVCPPDMVVLVKSAFFQNLTNAARSAQLITSHPGGPTIAVHHVDFLDVGFDQWDGWLALNPGDAVYGYATGDSVVCSVHGAILFGPPPFPPAERRQPRVQPRLPVQPLPAGATPSPLSPTRARRGRVNTV